MPDQDSLSWQVDGSVTNSSVGRDGNLGSHLTMREYDDQLNQLKKENLNLKLRIYFMEEQQGMLQTKNSPENVYKVNIDLKVRGEELKKVYPVAITITSFIQCSILFYRCQELEEKQQLLADAAEALESQVGIIACPISVIFSESFSRRTSTVSG